METSVPDKKMRAKRHKKGVLLLGVTGGIASGKTTVANMLERLGAPVIDFDVLAREVVEPDKPAWSEIVDYFGKQVLRRDRSLDRPMISGIVFQNAQKRKVLEDITHPRIIEEFTARVDKISSHSPDAIIQAVIPLLFEVGLQRLVHKVLVVYIARSKQLERLRERDKISENEAFGRLNAQLPIEEKVKFADYVIDNQASLHATAKQVELLWESLKRLQAGGVPPDKQRE